MRRRDGGPDLRPRAVARIEQTAGVEAGYGLLVERHPPGLAHDGSVPFEPEGPQVGELGLLHARTHARAVEVFDAHEEARPGGTGEEPGQQGGAQVTDVQRPCRAGGETPVGRGF